MEEDVGEEIALGIAVGFEAFVFGGEEVGFGAVVEVCDILCGCLKGAF